MKRVIRIDTLQWFISIYLIMRGAMMLILPHRLNTAVFVPIHSYFPWLGIFQVVGGAALITVNVLAPRRPMILLAHFVAAAALFQAMIGPLLTGNWTGVVLFGVLGMGTAIAPFLPIAPFRQKQLQALDLFALLMGLNLVAFGLLLFNPTSSQFSTPTYDRIRPYLWIFGLVDIGSGLAVLWAQIYRSPSRRSFKIAHVVAGSALWAWTASLGFPSLSAVLYFNGLGTLLAFLPWLNRQFYRFDPASLQTRLAIMLVGIVTLPLLFAVTLVSLPQEQSLLDQALILQQTLANALSQDITSFVGLHRSAVVALATQPKLMTLSQPELEELLQSANRAYPNIVFFGVYDESGHAIARSERQLIASSLSGAELYQTVRQANEVTIDIYSADPQQPPLFVFAAPLHKSDHAFAGLVIGAVESSRIAQQLAQTRFKPDVMVYLVDHQGRVIATSIPDMPLLADYSTKPPVIALQQQTRGSLDYWNPEDETWYLAGYAAIADSDWGVVVERSATDVLAAINTRRGRDFVALLIVTLLALSVGTALARKLTASLITLSYAAEQLAVGDSAAPLPNSEITEVAHLSSVFDAMRGNLAQRTAERNQAAQEREDLLVREREARKEAEAANRIKDEFLAVLSHELRSPLNPILGWAKLLRSRKFDQAGMDRALEIIERNARLQAKLIEDLLDISRILRGKLVLTVTPVDLVFVIEAALETVRLAAEAKQIQIKTHFEPMIGVVAGDSGRLQQVVWNLLSNAVKFTPPGGTVTVEVAQTSGYARIQISDTGKGINPEFLPYVFDYFRQADGATTRQFGGLGLGLAIVQHITELHGGTIEAYSLGEDQGATFAVCIPLSSRPFPLKEPPTTDHAFSDLTHLHILLVDDEADARELVIAILEPYGAIVKAVGSAAEALDYLGSAQPDILISDIGMPEVDGYALMRQIRQRPEEVVRPTPAIALTAYASEYDQKQALSVGFQRHLPKPLDAEELIHTLITLIPKP